MLQRSIVWMVLSGAGIGLAGAAGLEQGPQSVAGSDAVAARQASMDMSSIILRSMGDAVKAGRDAKSLKYPATALSKWSKVLPHLFPLGTGKAGTADTQARVEVWQDRAGFERVAANYVAATSQLAALAASNDTEGFKKQLAEVDQACHACHTRYKEGDQGAPTKK